MTKTQYYRHKESGEIFHFTEFGQGKFTLDDSFDKYTPPKFLIKISGPNVNKLFAWNIHLAERDDMQPYMEPLVVIPPPTVESPLNKYEFTDKPLEKLEKKLIISKDSRRKLKKLDLYYMGKKEIMRKYVKKGAECQL